MQRQQAQHIIETLKDYSTIAADVLEYLEKYDYRDDASNWHTDTNPPLIEAEHPTLRDLYYRLTRLIGPLPFREDNIPSESHLSKANIEAFANYLNCTQDKQCAAKCTRIPIEPMKSVADAFHDLNLLTESRRLQNIYIFAYGIRRWHQKTKSNPGTPIKIIQNLNYDQATPAEISVDQGYKTFADLFKPSCNYTTPQKRALYNALKALYDTLPTKDADKTVMAVILLFRKSKSKYHQPFITTRIGICKEKAMASFGRDTSNIKSYSDHSLENAPRIGEDHVKRAETIISKALETTR